MSAAVVVVCTYGPQRGRAGEPTQSVRILTLHAAGEFVIREPVRNARYLLVWICCFPGSGDGFVEPWKSNLPQLGSGGA
jgi:hypothetical protein